MEVAEVVEQLEREYGPPEGAGPTDAFGMLLWETVAYMADDERRRQAFDLLRDSIGLDALAIAQAPDEALLAVTRHGIMAEARVDRLREVAQTVLDRCGGDLDGALDRLATRAKGLLKQFPGIGDPGAEKILLFTGRAATPAWESNGLRVLNRLGFGTETKDYTASYRSAKAAVLASLPDDLASDCGWLSRAHLLLRRHGKEVCRRAAPDCLACPFRSDCPHAPM